jgi:hypothetical protein
VEDVFSHDPRVHIYVSNLRQILIVPFWDEYGLSAAARIFDFPIDAEKIGYQVVDVLTRLINGTLELKENAKNYWLLPQNINSWNKFQDCSMLITICREKNALTFKRHYAIPRRGFYPESTSADLVLSPSVTPIELGNAILMQFEQMHNNDFRP